VFDFDYLIVFNCSCSLPASVVEEISTPFVFGSRISKKS
jgi:hypothetical protein